jgi:hypothetical protein
MKQTRRPPENHSRKNVAFFDNRKNDAIAYGEEQEPHI